MVTQRYENIRDPQPRLDEVLEDIAYFRRRMSEAERTGDPEGSVLQAVYAPFLARRLDLLSRLKGKRAGS